MPVVLLCLNAGGDESLKGETYEEFVEKFKPNRTTDDCYTPPEIYETVKAWACKEYGIDPDKIVRPFWPGGDYESFDYKPDSVVLDNPPFSILSKICEFYLDRGIPFFLFVPTLTCFASNKTCMRMNHIITGTKITYENGAVVNTSFVTSFGGDVVAKSCPELRYLLEKTSMKLRKRKKRGIHKYSYPDHVLNAAMLERFSKNGVHFEVRRSDCVRVSKLDYQKEHGKGIFGSGLLMSDGKAAEKAAAEKAANYVWELSEREKEIVRSLGC